MRKRCPGGVREAFGRSPEGARRCPGGVREGFGRSPEGAREVPETVPEKGSSRRFWPAAAGGARNGNITAKPREECADSC